MSNKSKNAFDGFLDGYRTKERKLEGKTAEEIKQTLIDFASQGGDQRTQTIAEKLINNVIQAHTAQALDELEDKIKSLKSYKMVYSSYSGECDMIDRQAVLELIEEAKGED